MYGSGSELDGADGDVVTWLVVCKASHARRQPTTERRQFHVVPVKHQLTRQFTHTGQLLPIRRHVGRQLPITAVSTTAAVPAMKPEATAMGINKKFHFYNPQKALPCAEPRRLTF